MPRVGCIVEGVGDVASVPIILRRIAERESVTDLDVPKPMRVSRLKIVRPGELERAVELTARRLGGKGGILVLLDADDDKPCELGPRLLERARKERSDIPSAVVLAKSEKEAWFLAASESLQVPLRGAAPPEYPEGIRGAKEWISRAMGGPYSEVTHQPALAATFDLDLARSRSPSFDKFWRDVARILTDIGR